MHAYLYQRHRHSSGLQKSKSSTTVFIFQPGTDFQATYQTAKSCIVKVNGTLFFFQATNQLVINILLPCLKIHRCIVLFDKGATFNVFGRIISNHDTY